MSMTSRMNGRQFKKLCKRAHALVIQIDPRAERQTYRAGYGDGLPLWWHFPLLKGTLGFGGMTGYETPEWEDDSAFSVLWDHVFWSICDDSKCHLGEYPEWPKGKQPRRAQDLIELAKELIAAKAVRHDGI